MDTYPKALLGYRGWYVNWETLDLQPITPHGHGNPWQPGINHAECWSSQVGIQHPVPDIYCTCGLYAYHDSSKLSDMTVLALEKFKQGRSLIGGAVAGKGNVQMHSEGFRAQQSQVLGFFYNPDRADAEPEKLAALAEKYQVKVFPAVEALRAHAEGLAIPCPELQRLPDAELTHSQAFAELSLGRSIEAAAARELLQVHGFGSSVIDHFAIGVLPGDRCITAPLYFDLKGNKDLWTAPIFSEANCKQCGAVVSRQELLNVLHAHNKKARAAFEQTDQPLPEWRGCPHCQADSVSAGVGWLARDRQRRRGFVWQSLPDTKLPLYNQQAAINALEDSEYLYLTDSVPHTWSLWSQGHKAVVAHTKALHLGEEGTRQAKLAMQIATEYNKTLVHVCSWNLQSMALNPKWIPPGSKVESASINQLVPENMHWDLRAVELNANDYYN